MGAILSHEGGAEDLGLDDAVEIETFLRSLTDRTFTKGPRLSLPTAFFGRPRRG